MYKGKKIIALTPARGGSRGVKKKNVKLLNGKPLISWSLDLAQRVKEIDDVYVSTDANYIKDVARKSFAKVIDRPKKLSGDNVLVVDVLKHFLSSVNEQIDYLILLEATSPIRSEKDIIESIKLLIDEDYDSVGTFCEAHLNPHRAWRFSGEKPEVFIKGAIPWLPRQMLPEAYQLNGAVYGINVKRFLEDKCKNVLFGNIGGKIMAAHTSVDIDREVDFLVVEAIMNNLES